MKKRKAKQYKGKSSKRKFRKSRCRKDSSSEDNDHEESAIYLSSGNEQEQEEDSHCQPLQYKPNNEIGVEEDGSAERGK